MTDVGAVCEAVSETVGHWPVMRIEDDGTWFAGFYSGTWAVAPEGGYDIRVDDEPGPDYLDPPEVEYPSDQYHPVDADIVEITDRYGDPVRYVKPV